jgi:hypothetical protein
MNIEINIETLLFRIDTYTDHTKLVVLLNWQKDVVLQVSS